MEKGARIATGSYYRNVGNSIVGKRYCDEESDMFGDKVAPRFFGKPKTSVNEASCAGSPQGAFDLLPGDYGYVVEFVLESLNQHRPANLPEIEAVYEPIDEDDYKNPCHFELDIKGYSVSALKLAMKSIITKIDDMFPGEITPNGKKRPHTQQEIDVALSAKRVFYEIFTLHLVQSSE